ncbi:MAG TPA: alpha-amylase family glycosyl hydrolase [Steroidobacteraceae bacterium]
MLTKKSLVVLGLLLAVLQLGATTAPAGSARAADDSVLVAHVSPNWVKDGVIYEIFPRDFSSTGGLAGVTQQLDRLQQLGVNILWLMPIHPLGEREKKGTLGSPYAVRDYYAINPDYGNAEDLHHLVTEAHKHRMKVIIDIVANHTSWDSVMMQNPEYYKHGPDGKILPGQWDWLDVAKLNYDNPALRQYMTDMLVYWIRDFDLDGFRCDAADYVPTSFWESARAAITQVKPDVVMLAEAERPELLLKAFDIDYAWSMLHTVETVILTRQPASAVRVAWSKAARRYPQGALRMRFSDNHDQRRAIVQFGEPAALAASALMFTLDGVPMLYNGMEVGDKNESGAPELFEKLPINWPGPGQQSPISGYYQRLIAFRRAHPALTAGKVLWLSNTDESRVLTFLRVDAHETVLVAINLSDRPFMGRVWGSDGAYSDITPRDPQTAGKRGPANALPALSLGAWEFRAYGK